MTEGLVFLPRIQAERQRQLDNDVMPDQVVNAECNTCRLNEDERAGWFCGWMDPDLWRHGELRPYPDATVCPGYSTSIPDVIETSRLLLWTRRGELRAVVQTMPIPPAAALCIDILDSACNESERETFRRQRQEAESKRQGGG